ncbi:hypothetical protein EK904_005812 [Melospiza melodia maxima]|nr:hypothetical protein EK904_005812 [Melospiza melodia maxima]
MLSRVRRWGGNVQRTLFLIGQRMRRRCCSKASTVKKNPHKAIGFKGTPVEARKPCKPCPLQGHGVFSGPLPQLK